MSEVVFVGFECCGRPMGLAGSNCGPAGHVTYNVQCGHCGRRVHYDPAERPPLAFVVPAGEIEAAALAEEAAAASTTEPAQRYAHRHAARVLWRLVGTKA